MYAGIKIIESASCVDVVGEDWSEVRSPARARRRRRYGHPQRIKPLYAPKKEAFVIDGGRTVIMHPEMARKMAAAIAQRDTEIARAAGCGFIAPDESATSCWAREMMQKRADGKKAGPLRNQKMLNEGKPDLVAGFPGGTGTEDMLRRAKKAGVLISRVIVVE